MFDFAFFFIKFLQKFYYKGDGHVGHISAKNQTENELVSSNYEPQELHWKKEDALHLRMSSHWSQLLFRNAANLQGKKKPRLIRSVPKVLQCAYNMFAQNVGLTFCLLFLSPFRYYFYRSNLFDFVLISAKNAC